MLNIEWKPIKDYEGLYEVSNDGIIRRLVIKRWVENILLIIQCILIVFLSAECNDLKVEIISKTIMLIIFILNNIILIKYGRLFYED